MRTITSPSAGSTIVDKLKVYEGGTGSVDAASARTALGAVALSELNAANGIAGLDANGQLSATQVPDDGAAPISLQGPTFAIINATIAFTITNYDIFTPYNLSATLGTVTRDRSTIYYTAGATPGTGSITINGRVLNFTVQGVQPVAPTLTAVDISGSAVNTAALVCTGNAFAMNTASVNTHLNTDWQVASDESFTTIVSQSLANTTDKTAWVSGNLNLTTTYYARCRYRDNAAGVSDWSNVVTLTTKPNYIPNVEQAKLLASDRLGADRLGWAVALSSDGDRLVVSAYNKTLNSISAVGAVYVFKRTGTTWAQEAQLITNTTPIVSANSSDWFGFRVSVDTTATRVVVGCPQEDAGATGNSGAVYVYIRSGTSWTLEQKITNPAPAVNTCFGACVAICGDGTRLAVYRPANTLGSTGSPNSSVRIYLRTGSSWAVETTLTNELGTNTTMGESLAMDSTGTRLVAGAALDWNAGGTDYTGFFYIFVRAGVNWTREHRYNYSGYAVADYFGFSVAIDSTGTRVVIGAPRSDTSATDGGIAVVFRRSGTTWTQEQVLAIGDPGASAGAGDSVAISADGMFIAISSSSGRQAAYVFKRTGTTWAQAAKVQASDRLTTGGGNSFSSLNFGQYSSIGVALDAYGRTMAVGAAADQNGNASFGSAGAAYIYTT